MSTFLWAYWSYPKVGNTFDFGSILGAVCFGGIGGEGGGAERHMGMEGLTEAMVAGALVDPAVCPRASLFLYFLLSSFSLSLCLSLCAC